METALHEKQDGTHWQGVPLRNCMLLALLTDGQSYLSPPPPKPDGNRRRRRRSEKLPLLLDHPTEDYPYLSGPLLLLYAGLSIDRWWSTIIIMDWAVRIDKGDFLKGFGPLCSPKFCLWRSLTRFSGHWSHKQNRSPLVLASKNHLLIFVWFRDNLLDRLLERI